MTLLSETILSETIQKICACAKLAQDKYLNDEKEKEKEYANYTKEFEKLLGSKISNIDPEKQKIINEIIRTVFMAYDDMTEGPQKLALYIKELVTQLEADPNYLQDWSIQSVIDAFVDPQDKTYSDIDPSLEKYVNDIENEMDEVIKLYNQKSAASREDHIQDSGLLNDGDDADADLVLLNEDPQALNGKRENTNLSHDRVSLVSETSGLTSEDASFSSENEVTTEFLAEFSKKFNEIIRRFKAGFVTQRFLATDRQALNDSMNHVIGVLENSYEICFNKTVSTKSLDDFDSLVESIINNWNYTKDKDKIVSTKSLDNFDGLAKFITHYWTDADDKKLMSTALATQAFAELKLNLMNLTKDTREDERLNPPSSSSSLRS